MSVRIRNIIFALILGAILGITFWSLHAREPGLFKVKPLPLKEEALAKRGGNDSSEKKEQTIEKMIEAGELSNKRALYYRKIGK